MSHAPSSSDDSHDDSSSSTTPGATPTHSTFVGRLPLHRSVSQASQWSPSDTPRHHHEGTSYFPSTGTSAGRASSPTPKRTHYPYPSRTMSSSSVRRPRTRSTSIASSRAAGRSYRDEEGILSEEDEDMEYEHSRSAAGGYERDDAHDSRAEDEDEDEERDEDPITVKERQSLINVEHPFGLPIWKPALYKKSRSVTRYADQELHSVPSAQAERHLLPGNIFWAVAFGWWLALVCFVVSALLRLAPFGGKQYATLVYGLGWYIAWPFGKYVEGDIGADHSDEDEESPADSHSMANGDDSTETLTREQPTDHPTITPRTALHHQSSVSWDPNTVVEPRETTSLLSRPAPLTPSKSYGATPASPLSATNKGRPSGVGKVLYYLLFTLFIAPWLFLVCTICWGLVFTVPMAKLTWALLKYMYQNPGDIRFCSAPVVAVTVDNGAARASEENCGHVSTESHISFKHARLAAGQAAPSGSPTSTVLLCTYRAFGWKYYKYTVGGVNILFVNLMPLVFLVILDKFILLAWVERRERAGLHVPAFLALISARPFIFVLSLASVIPLSYFIGMAVASISAQSSIGMGAVINATFGSIIEIILYAIALTERRGHLVEGSIVGSLLAGVLLMPGASMCSGAIRQKEMKFNAKSAGITSMLLIMAFIGTIAPTLFYQTYGSFQLVCEGCPAGTSLTLPKTPPWVCDHCYYEHPDPVDDPFYQSTVKSLMFFCAAILLLSYLIGLWFSLRTHASQIWQNPQQLLHPTEMPVEPSNPRISLYQRLLPGTFQKLPSVHHKPSIIHRSESRDTSRSQTPVPRGPEESLLPLPQSSSQAQNSNQAPTTAAAGNRRISYANPPVINAPGMTPLLESVDYAIHDSAIHPLQLPGNLTQEDFTRAVAVATVSALRHQQNQGHSPARPRINPDLEAAAAAGGHGGHDSPSWSRVTSASVLLACTALYAAIAEILVDVVDVVLEGSGIDEKFLGVTLFALVPNTTEFMNAMSFAMNGNIALSMEIGSAYALQVCLLQIPAMVAFSAWYAPDRMGSVADTFTLIFPRWDVICIILSVFLMTYTYIEAKSNYHRGSILILSYLVLLAGFYYAPQRTEDDTFVGSLTALPLLQSFQAFFTLR
ncbi:calcium/proton exchange-like protein [Phanerochaete sordida]|uniref:Calcium/proton exchange-like protein n=1 Tax=Phanerochaete sordida TaxID=48140 RepID=A0A9P3G9B0_9APHY|nr:calcium/proton exchange-like protein [Phanerochaete sordida]